MNKSFIATVGGIAGAALLVGAAMAFTMAPNQDSGGGAGGGASQQASEKATAADCWDAYGDAERKLSSSLSASIWKEAVQGSGARTMTCTGTEAKVVSDGDVSTVAYGLKDVESQQLDADGEQITRTTATAVGTDGTAYDLMLDEAADGSRATLRCGLFGQSAWTSTGSAGECQVSAVPAGVNGLIGGTGEQMRAEVASYIQQNLPTATVAECSPVVTVDYRTNTAYIPWSVTSAEFVTLSADVDLSTHKITVARQEG